MSDDVTLNQQIGNADTIRAAFDDLPVLLAVLEGPEHRFVAANAAYRAFTGQQELIGSPVHDQLPELPGEQLFEVLDRVHTTGRAEVIREWRLQVDQGRTGDPPDMYASFTITPRLRSDGAVRGASVLMTDVTEQVAERQAAQAEVVEAKHRYTAAREVAAQLQEALLPTSLPVLPGVRVAARYFVAASDQAAGGDWFDAVPLPDGQLALVVGDIVGHGVAAAAAMGQLRAVLEELLIGGDGLERMLVRVNRLAARIPAMNAATVCVAVLDPATGALTYATCGHPSPLVVSAEGTTRHLDPTGDPPLGTGTSSPTIATSTLRTGEVLLTYSDGLIEGPGQTLTAGQAKLAEVVGDAVTGRAGPAGAPASAAERVCQAAVELLARTGYDDDVTAVAVQRRPDPVEPWRLDLLSTETDRLSELRSGLGDWLHQVEPAQAEEDTLQLAVTELVANAIKHAYPDGQGQIRLRAELTSDGVAHVQVVDDGSWQEPDQPAADHGRGLWIVDGLVDELNLVRSPAGTVATARHRLSHPATLVSEPTGQGVPHQRGIGPFTAQLHAAGDHGAEADAGTGRPPMVRVSGPIDITTAEEFAEQLTQASRGGLHPLVIDLSGVEVLASAGVRVLFTMRDQLAVHDHPLELIAAPASPARVILDLVGLTGQARVYNAYDEWNSSVELE